MLVRVAEKDPGIPVFTEELQRGSQKSERNDGDSHTWRVVSGVLHSAISATTQQSSRSPIGFKPCLAPANRESLTWQMPTMAVP